jgi:excisionase family DNA binding protein
MWLTLDEVTEYLRVSKETVYKLAQRGKIPGTKVGNQWRFRKDLLEAALVSNSSSLEVNARPAQLQSLGKLEGANEKSTGSKQ